MVGTGVTLSSSVVLLYSTEFSNLHRILCIQLVSTGIFSQCTAIRSLNIFVVGYAGYYGLSLIVGSYPVLFASLAAHAAQFAFLVFFENPRMFSFICTDHLSRG